MAQEPVPQTPFQSCGPSPKLVTTEDGVDGMVLQNAGRSGVAGIEDVGENQSAPEPFLFVQ